ncbi:MAG: QcrA and Rieske domain-containing protein [Candidatus Anammoxibacter sp.]
MKRREFFNKSLIFVLGIAGAGIIVEAVAVVFRFLMPSGDRKSFKTFVCFHSDILPGQAKEIHSRGNKLILVNNEGNVMAFSATCPHLGCSVKWNRKKSEFLCPCHIAAFDRNGEVVSGPPPRALDQYRVLIEGNSVFVFVPENYRAQRET